MIEEFIVTYSLDTKGEIVNKEERNKIATFLGIKKFSIHNAAVFTTGVREFVLDKPSLIERIKNLREQGIDVSEELKGLKAIKEANK